MGRYAHKMKASNCHFSGRCFYPSHHHTRAHNTCALSRSLSNPLSIFHRLHGIVRHIHAQGTCTNASAVIGFKNGSVAPSHQTFHQTHCTRIVPLHFRSWLTQSVSTLNSQLTCILLFLKTRPFSPGVPVQPVVIKYHVPSQPARSSLRNLI
jgi:hypothetical protein